MYKVCDINKYFYLNVVSELGYYSFYHISFLKRTREDSLLGFPIKKHKIVDVREEGRYAVNKLNDILSFCCVIMF